MAGAVQWLWAIARRRRLWDLLSMFLATIPTSAICHHIARIQGCHYGLERILGGHDRVCIEDPEPHLALFSVTIHAALFGTFFFLEMLAQWYLRSPNNSGLFVEETATLRAPQIANGLFERAVLFRWNWTGYFNGVYVNLRIVAAYVTTSWIALAVLIVWALLDIQAEAKTVAQVALTLFFATWGGIFWRERSTLHGKWLYLAGLYNEYLKIGFRRESADEPANRSQRDLLAASLVLDTLTLHLWRHRSFRETIARTFRMALAEISQRARRPRDPARLWGAIKAGGVRRDVAEGILEIYQASLLDGAEEPDRNEIEWHLDQIGNGTGRTATPPLALGVFIALLIPAAFGLAICLVAGFLQGAGAATLFATFEVGVMMGALLWVFATGAARQRAPTANTHSRPAGTAASAHTPTSADDRTSPR